MSFRRILLLFLLCIGLPSVATGLFLLFRSSPETELATAVAKVGDLDQVVLAVGRLRPKELVNVGAQVSGQVKRLYVSLGQSVRQGDPIADIDSKPQQLALRAARAAERALRAQKAARAGALVQAQLTHKRQQDMLAADATTRAEYEAAQAALSSNQGELRAVEAQLSLARSQTETALLHLGFTRIVAPMSGVVIAVVAKEGQTVNSQLSTPTIVVLANLDVMTVRTEISEADVEKVRPGQTVWFTTLGASDRKHMAQIDRIEPAPEMAGSDGVIGAAPGPGTASAIYYNALFDVANPDGLLRPAMTAQVSVLLARARGALIIPTSALGPRDADGRHAVRVLDGRQRTTERKVRLGIGNDSHVTVLDGLQAGERLLIAEAKGKPPAAEIVRDF